MREGDRGEGWKNGTGEVGEWESGREGERERENDK